MSISSRIHPLKSIDPHDKSLFKAQIQPLRALADESFAKMYNIIRAEPGIFRKFVTG
jgi:hypothetical protein